MQRSLFDLEMYHLRSYQPNDVGGVYRTEGPYFLDEALQRMKEYLFKGICSWVEKIE
tara:strand:- start:406 stop:576 length:171 start_codon:yes stop_codon:yes gene_type:complete